jgi:hypothetical protein
MKVLEGLEDKLKAFVEDAVHEAEANIAPIEAAVADALHEAGAPPEIAAALGSLVKLLREHFSSLAPAAQPGPAPEPQPDPGVPQQ